MITLEIQGIRTSPIIILYGVYLYLAGMGFSYRRVEEALNNWAIERSYEAVRKWVQRLGAGSRGFFETGQAKVAVIDETKIKIGESWLWLWVAMEPERRKILAMALTGSRNSLISRSFLKELKGRYGRVKIITDMTHGILGLAGL